MAEANQPYDIGAVLDDVKEDLEDYMKIEPVLQELEEAKVFRLSKLRNIREEHPTTTTKKIQALIELLKNEGYIQYDQFKRCLSNSGQHSLVDKIEAAEKRPDLWKKPMTAEEKLLQEDLIQHYLQTESTMPVAPLVEKHDVELTSFYVRSPMMAYKKPFAFGQEKQFTEQEKTNVCFYSELLLNGNDPYKRIYVTADAGMGKTSFSKMLTRTWCQAHKPDKSVEDKFHKDDLDTIRKFDFLFLIHLREYQRTNMCGLDEMIINMLQTKLPRKSSYALELLNQVLCNRHCLIIVDGLDEWSHPEHGPEKAVPKEVIPHTKYWPNCSVLTTTRPWKLSTAKLSTKDIDRQVEISQLDDTTSRKLKDLAISFLNKNQTDDRRSVASTESRRRGNFDEEVPVTILQDIRYIPYILLQMICLWFKNLPIGKSLCEVYSNIIELTLTRWLVKTDFGHENCKCEPSKEHENIECIKNTHCRCYMPLLLKTGRLAFLTLFNQKKSLLFEKRETLDCLSDEELNNCLNMGLLSRVKDTTSLTEELMQLYFPHKTFHEFFCALFIATNWNNSDTEKNFMKQTISDKCTSVSDIVEMSKVFVFVCGLNPSVYSDISRYLATIVAKDKKVIDYRNNVEEVLYPSELYLYQSMQVSCLLENNRNGHTECKIVQEDIIILSPRLTEQTEPVLAKIISDNASDIKSLYGYHLTQFFYCNLKESKLSRLETLRLISRVSGLYSPIFSTVFQTLKCLMLQDIKFFSFETKDLRTATNLHGLRISRCSLETLGVLFYSAAMLETLILEDLGFYKINLTTLTRLRKFTLRNCDVIFRVIMSPDMTSLETIELMNTKMDISCWEELFLSVGKLLQDINVKLQDISMNVEEWKELFFDVLGKLRKHIHIEMFKCKGPSQEEWSKIFDEMEASEVFCVKESFIREFIYLRKYVFYADIVFDILGV